MPMQTTELLSYILHHISLPLVQALIEQAYNVDNAEDLNHQIVALLEDVVRHGEGVRDILNVSDYDKENSALRMHVASFSSKIIASEYRVTGQIPTAQDLRKTIAMVNTSLVFCENYIPLQNLSDIYPENANRPASFLKNLADLKYLESIVPLINAINAFSFGEQPQKMIQNVSENILHYTIDMREKILGSNLHYLEEKEANRYIMHNLAGLYETIHMAELKRVEGLSTEALQTETSEKQIENIQRNFHMQYSTLLELTKNILPDDVGDGVSDTNHENLGTHHLPEQDSAGFAPMSFYKKSD